MSSESAKFSKIQYGINVAANGDTILAAAGTYVENINFNGKNISVIGEDRETTIIDGNQAGSVVTFENGESPTALLSRFTIQNGAGFRGGGIYFSESNARLDNLSIVNNNSSETGGGVAFMSSSQLDTEVTISGNLSLIHI